MNPTQATTSLLSHVKQVLCQLTTVLLVIFMKDFIFASQESFAKTETAKFFVVLVQTELTAFQSVLFLEVPTNRRVSVSVPLTAMAKAIQDCQQIKAQTENPTVAHGREQKQLFLRTSWVRGYCPATLKQRAQISISLCKLF